MARRTDDEWVAALRGDLGDRAQEAAYRDLARYVFKVAYNYLRYRRDSVPGLADKPDYELVDLAEEFTQAVLVKVALDRLYNAYRGDAAFTSYVAVVARRVVAQALRRREWWVYTEPLPPPEPEYEPESGESLPPLELEASSDLTPEALQLQEEAWETIRRCVEQLPERWRRAFVLKVFDNLSAAEVKERLDIEKEQTVHTWVFRARRWLKSCLADSGWNLNDIWRLFS